MFFYVKGTVSRDFLLLVFSVFSWISFPPAPEYPIRAVSSFFKIRGDIRKSRWPNKIMKTFMIEDFFPFTTGVSDTGGAVWAVNISTYFQKNLKTALWNTQGLGGIWSMKKNLKSKILWHLCLWSAASFLPLVFFKQYTYRRYSTVLGTPSYYRHSGR